MTNAVVTITAQATYDDGTPFLAADLKSVLIEVKALAATTWTAVGTPLQPGETSKPVNNLSGGTWVARGTWTDTHGRTSVPSASATLSLAATLLPGTVTFTVAP